MNDYITIHDFQFSKESILTIREKFKGTEKFEVCLDNKAFSFFETEKEAIACFVSMLPKPEIKMENPISFDGMDAQIAGLILSVFSQIVGNVKNTVSLTKENQVVGSSFFAIGFGGSHMWVKQYKKDCTLGKQVLFVKFSA